MNAKVSRNLRWVCPLAFSVGLLWPAAAVAVTITPITGSPVTISADTAGAGWTTVTGPLVTEGNSKECSPGNIVINAPSGFEFNTAATVTATTIILNGNGTAFTVGPVSITSSSITVHVNAPDTSGSRAKLTFAGIQVRPTQGSPLASGNLTTNGCTAFTSASPNNYGTLTEVAGALDHFAISPISSPQNAGTPITGITLTAQDAHNNTVTNFSSTVTYGGTAGITGTSAAFTLGQLTGVSVTPMVAGSGMTFTVSASGKTGTSTFNVNPAGLDHFLISPIPSPQTAGIPITGITLTAQDVFNNTLTSFGSSVTYGGSAGITGTSASFVSGQLTGVSVTPMVAGSGLTFTVSASGKSGTATFNVNKPTPSISGVSASQSISYGTASVTLSGTVSATGPFYPANGETVPVTVNGVTQNATISGGAGGFSLSYSTATIPASATPYTITYAYAGDAILNAAPNNTSTVLTVNKATPTITTPPTASPITYGQTLASSALSSGAASVAGTFAFTTPATAPSAGTYSASVTFTPTDTANYNTATTLVNVSVGKATPSVTTWPTASGITYGQALSASTLTGGSASVGGSFAFATPSLTPGTGTFIASVTFTPTDTANYNPVVGSVNVAVAKATPSVTTWPTASGITYGQALSASALSGGSASVGGAFTFTIPSSTPNAGIYSASVTFTPTDTADYTTVVGSVNVAVAKATPSVTTWPTAGGITYGQALSASTLTGGSTSVGGGFAFTAPSTTPNAGTYSASVAFTPTDTANYNPVVGSVNVAVAKATPSVTTWPTASGIAYGQPLSASTLTGGSASVGGGFAFTTPALVPPSVGTYSASVTFTPTDTANYNTVAGLVNVAVANATPTVTTWPTATGITYGQALSASTLGGGSASVPGTFAFTTPSTIPNAGSYSAPVTFTPTDTASYSSVVGSVNVAVAKATPSVTTWPTASTITYGETLASSTLSGGAASVGGSFAFTTTSTTPNAGTYSASVTFTPTDTANYNTTSGTVSVTVNAGVSGAMQLYGYLGPTEIVVTFVAKDSNSNTVGQAEMTFPAPGGLVSYSVGVPGNTKTLSVKPRFYLRKRFDVSSQITGQNQVAMNLGTFTGGDVNEDNQVDLTDYAWLRTCWGTSGPQYEINGPPLNDPKNFPDLNGDGTIDSLDYEILRNGWYQAGDPQ